MPIYEYQCEKCKKISNFLVRNVSGHKLPACPRCGHATMNRLFSRFAAVRAGSAAASTGADEATSPADGGEDVPDMPDLDGLDEKDPRSMGRLMRKMAEESGEALDPEMNEICRRLESGEDPKNIEEALGDSESGPGAGGSDDTLYDG